MSAESRAKTQKKAPIPGEAIGSIANNKSDSGKKKELSEKEILKRKKKRKNQRRSRKDIRNRR
jgi:hypothetical protein